MANLIINDKDNDSYDINYSFINTFEWGDEIIQVIKQRLRNEFVNFPQVDPNQRMSRHMVQVDDGIKNIVIHNTTYQYSYHYVFVDEFLNRYEVDHNKIVEPNSVDHFHAYEYPMRQARYYHEQFTEIMLSFKDYADHNNLSSFGILCYIKPFEQDQQAQEEANVSSLCNIL
jgi:hypothetical protein